MTKASPLSSWFPKAPPQSKWGFQPKGGVRWLRRLTAVAVFLKGVPWMWCGGSTPAFFPPFVPASKVPMAASTDQVTSFPQQSSRCKCPDRARRRTPPLAPVRARTTALFARGAPSLLKGSAPRGSSLSKRPPGKGLRKNRNSSSGAGGEAHDEGGWLFPPFLDSGFPVSGVTPLVFNTLTLSLSQSTG